MKPVALITGAGRGIGFGIAECLAREGMDLAVADILPEGEVAANMEALRHLGAEVLYCCCDVSNPEDRRRALSDIRQRFGRLHVLVNNAGVAPRVRADLLEATEESYEWVMRINLQGPYFLTQEVARWMIEQKNADRSFAACIVNISSISAEVASITRGEYCISKAGLSMATKLWAARLAEHEIPVYEIRPGIIATPMTAGVREKYDKLLAEGICLQRRWGQPADIGKAVAMLCRGDLAYSTGQVIYVDGGFNVRRL